MYLLFCISKHKFKEEDPEIEIINTTKPNKSKYTQGTYKYTQS